MKFVPSKKNKPAQLFLESITSTVKRTESDGWILMLSRLSRQRVYASSAPALEQRRLEQKHHPLGKRVPGRGAGDRKRCP